jgi:hypothetical protein
MGSYNGKVYKKQGGDEMVVANGGKITIESGGLLSRARVLQLPAASGKAGATAGFANPSAHSGFTNSGVVGLPASQTASTFVIPVTGLKVGDIISAFSVQGQIESGGQTVTLDAALRKITASAAGDLVDASLGSITQVSVIADTLVSSSKTLDTPDTVAANESFYILLTGTTGSAADVQVAGVTVSVNEV